MKKIALAFISGILMGLTTAPVSAWFLAWVALVPLWILITSKKESYLLISLAWGLGYHGLALFWITGIHPMTWIRVLKLVSLDLNFERVCFIVTNL